MRAGSLNRLVTIKRPVTGQDAAGQPLLDKVEVATVWANVRYMTGSESIRSDKDTSIVKASIRIRRRTDLNAGMEVHLGSTVYEIKAILPDEESRERVDLVCEVVS
jgi:SPP1 family predicted phage head-tail adaptor